MRVFSLKEAGLNGESVYRVRGDAAVSENEQLPPIWVFFKFRASIRRDGRMTITHASMWQRGKFPTCRLSSPRTWIRSFG